ncbi:hypothetical protein VSH64_16980 [Amycolatopsis rhabdoformis]|uniref:Uncharacterized protein n=1 Tax=Amycolatopsis rhabdoformis TaxID=1448059 RepID=A0ABZ1IH38_9PSEU|nr:hypothetical protein [Amycolatopsis rhabdoformis]WSE33781.1 hypothetical protein VSH64_16980 [Amycolatopsis rhabdoformis]
MSDSYTAAIVHSPEAGVRLRPDATDLPGDANDVNLLGMAIALALGRAGYEHHAEARDPQLQTLDALIAGDTVMPWRRPDDSTDEQHLTCTRAATGAWRCEVTSA